MFSNWLYGNLKYYLSADTIDWKIECKDLCKMVNSVYCIFFTLEYIGVNTQRFLKLRFNIHTNTITFYSKSPKFNTNLQVAVTHYEGKTIDVNIMSKILIKLGILS